MQGELTMAFKDCKHCGKEFKYFPSQQEGMFCSRTCNQDYRIKTIMESGTATKGNAKTYLKRHADYKCSCCGISEWNGKELVLQVEHKDGNNKNNTIDNVCWLCPNCHTQTSTWGSRNASPEAKERMLKGLATGWSTRKNKSRTVKEIDSL